MPGNGRKGAKRRNNATNVTNQTLPNKVILRLARRGGVKRLSALVYDQTRDILRVFLENLIRDAFAYSKYSKRNTVTALDVSYALKRNGGTMSGFGN